MFGFGLNKKGAYGHYFEAYKDDKLEWNVPDKVHNLLAERDLRQKFEHEGIIKVYSGLSHPTTTLPASLR